VGGEDVFGRGEENQMKKKRKYGSESVYLGKRTPLQKKKVITSM